MTEYLLKLICYRCIGEFYEKFRFKKSCRGGGNHERELGTPLAEIDVHVAHLSDLSSLQGRELERGFNSNTSIGKKNQNNLSETNLFTHLPIHLFTSKKAAFTLAEDATYVAHWKDSRKVAFTLAEVLITLGIIGVVAALTLPVLINNYKKIETSSRLKKFYSAMSQAVLQSKDDNGGIETWGIEKPAEGNISFDLNSFFVQYLSSYIKYTSTKYEYGNFYVYLSDGSYFRLSKGNCVDISYDVNGYKLPNEYGKDIFRFLLCGENTYGWCDGKHWCSYYYNNNNRVQRLERCKQRGMFCSGLLEYDNWEFKSDYPYRL